MNLPMDKGDDEDDMSSPENGQENDTRTTRRNIDSCQRFSHDDTRPSHRNNGSHSIQSTTSSQLLTFYKVLAIVCCYLFSVGSHYETHLYSSIKTDLKEGMGLSNSQFHILSSVISLPNTVLPIVVGMLTDVFGNRIGSFTATTLILIGTTVASLAVNLNHYPMLVIGRFIFG